MSWIIHVHIASIVTCLVALVACHSFLLSFAPFGLLCSCSGKGQTIISIRKRLYFCIICSSTQPAHVRHCFWKGAFLVGCHLHSFEYLTVLLLVCNIEQVSQLTFIKIWTISNYENKKTKVLYSWFWSYEKIQQLPERGVIEPRMHIVAVKWKIFLLLNIWCFLKNNWQNKTKRWWQKST